MEALAIPSGSFIHQIEQVSAVWRTDLARASCASNLTRCGAQKLVLSRLVGGLTAVKKKDHFRQILLFTHAQNEVRGTRALFPVWS